MLYLLTHAHGKVEVSDSHHMQHIQYGFNCGKEMRETTSPQGDETDTAETAR